MGWASENCQLVGIGHIYTFKLQFIKVVKYQTLIEQAEKLKEQKDTGNIGKTLVAKRSHLVTRFLTDLIAIISKGSHFYLSFFVF